MAKELTVLHQRPSPVHDEKCQPAKSVDHGDGCGGNAPSLPLPQNAQSGDGCCEQDAIGNINEHEITVADVIDAPLPSVFTKEEVQAINNLRPLEETNDSGSGNECCCETFHTFIYDFEAPTTRR